VTLSRDDLRADCRRCAGLCCVAPAFAASADFAIDKPAGTPCPHLAGDFRCSIHERLGPAGFGGCAVFDCFGAGQHVVQVTFLGRDWREGPATAGPVFGAFAAMRDLHELLWYLTEALDLEAAAPLRTDLAAARDRVERLTDAPAETLLSLDTEEVRRTVDPLLQRTSTLVRGVPGGPGLRRADLAGQRLAGADLRAADLRGAVLIGADLGGADLRRADVIGADLRGCDLRGADLGNALFLTQMQVNAARGDTATVLPPALLRPTPWGPA
jgi:uncharacterized protein YjbI with pentapeptide repeats